MSQYGAVIMNILTKSQSGFTLIELLVSLVIFAVGILGVATMQITSIKGNSKSRLISEASNIGADRIEMFLSLDYDDPLLDDDDGDGTGDGGGTELPTDDTGDYCEEGGGDIGIVTCRDCNAFFKNLGMCQGYLA